MPESAYFRALQEIFLFSKIIKVLLVKVIHITSFG